MKKALYIMGIVLLVIALPFMQIAKETSGKRRLNTNRVGRNFPPTRFMLLRLLLHYHLSAINDIDSLLYRVELLALKIENAGAGCMGGRHFVY